MVLKALYSRGGEKFVLSRCNDHIYRCCSVSILFFQETKEMNRNMTEASLHLFCNKCASVCVFAILSFFVLFVVSFMAGPPFPYKRQREQLTVKE